MKILLKFFFGLTFLVGFFAFVFLHPTFSHAAILQDENRTILEGGAGAAGFDDKAFNLNQLAGTVDSANYLLACQSQAHPELNEPCVQNNRSAMGAVSGLIATLYTPPASSIEYLAYLKENLGLSAPAYAQQTGTGFEGLRPLLPLWRVFRNAAYMVFILLFIIMGLMIMLRMKISPQAVISVQTALPQLVITLVLITISYAIAGFMIDLMYVFIYFLIGLLNQAGVPIGGAENFQNNVFAYWKDIGGLGFNSITTPAAGFRQIIDEITGANQGGMWFLAGVIGVAGQGIAFIVFTIAILFALFKLLFILIKAYVWVLVLVIFGPLILLMGALPGRGGGLSTWIRGLLSNLAVFPTTIVMFILASIFIQSTTPAGTEWVPPLIGGTSMDGVKALIGLGMILLTPQVAQMMNDAFKPAPFPYGVAIGQAVGAGPATMSRGSQRLMAGLIPAGKPGERQPWRILTG